MRAIRIDRVGGPDVLHLVDVLVGEPAAGQVRVRHHACGVNFIDIYHRSGLYPLALPVVLGTEAAGVVDAVGAGVHLAVGDRVAYAAGGVGLIACEWAKSLPARSCCCRRWRHTIVFRDLSETRSETRHSATPVR